MNGRNPHDHTRVLEDLPNPDVLALCQTLNITASETDLQSTNIIVCSGRKEVARQDTLSWLARYGLVPLELHLRLDKDDRPDNVVKSEIWADISTRYNIRMLFDDRDKVVLEARKNYTCLQVQPGDF